MTATTAIAGITFDGTDNFDVDITAVNAAITAYNTANSTDYPIWDTVTDDYEKLIQVLLVHARIMELTSNLDTFNLRITGNSSNNQTFGARGSIPSKQVQVSIAANNQASIWLDPDNAG